ncbi:MAG: aspartyl protease [Symploca sp. SIO2G7]|nr:aspartyl protease [Symploca sp. SIO2G7]
MIEGRFGDQGELLFEIELITGEDFPITVEAMLDTGFTGFLAMNKQDVEACDWNYLGKEELLTAQGETLFDIYLGKLILAGEEIEISVFAGDKIEEILLGLQWLKRFDLIAKYREAILRLE